MTSGDIGASWPPVSVIIATRHRPQQLEQAVRSVLSQAYPGELECVVVFDQSEPSPVRVDPPAHRVLRSVTNTRTPGLAGARNSGIEVTEGTLLAFCDDDDEWAAGKLLAQVGELLRAAAVFAGCGVRIRHSGHAVVRLPPPVVDLSQLVRDRVSALHPSTFMIHRELLREIGPVDERLPGGYAEDYDLLLRAARQAPIIAVQQSLVDVHWHERSFFAQRWDCVAAALAYLLRKHPELSSDPRGLARILGQIAFAEAARADRSAAVRSSMRALRHNPAERRAYLALAVAAGLPSGSVVTMANRRGRGI